jgi:hypothetical protein
MHAHTYTHTHTRTRTHLTYTIRIHHARTITTERKLSQKNQQKVESKGGDATTLKTIVCGERTNSFFF